ncbi:MAG: SUMF1/EgtB/PvdO family nonheme iron enzyme, partial [Gammaproteobacteria bacterium]|nr:SUMF1/EgtB/PvdO family nonheme iron enzyme [Gammaproteobacteria bacterium]
MMTTRISGQGTRLGSWPGKRFFMALWMLLSALFLLAAVAQAQPGKRGLMRIKDTQGQQVGLYKDSYALLIGVSDYTAGWPDLNSIPSELDRVEQLLEKQGYKVVRYPESEVGSGRLNSNELKDAFEDFIRSYGYDGDNRLLFFFSGHGHTWEQGDQGYLVPSDAPIPAQMDGYPGRDFLTKSLHMSQVMAWTRQMTARHALFLFDSCFSGSVFKTKAILRPKHISRVTAKPVRQFITAGSAREEVPARSVFTPAFVDALELGLADRAPEDGYVTGTELGQYLQQIVSESTEQTPQFGKHPDYRYKLGDYVFVAGGSVVHEDQPIETPGTGALRIETRPEGAAIWLGGKRKGAAPITLKGLKPGRVVLKATHPGYQSVEQRVRIRAGRRTPITLILEREFTTGSLDIISTPGDAIWYLNGDYMGRTPDEAGDIEAGRHQVEVKKAGYQPWQGTVTVVTGRQARIDARLEAEALEYALTVRATPVDARVRIMNIEPRYYAGMRLKPGRYHLRVDKGGYRAHDDWVELSEAEQVVEVDLERVSRALEPEMVAVKGGCFQMGSPESEAGRDDDEHRHRVCVEGFRLGKTEVTVGEFRRFVKATGYRSDAEKDAGGKKGCRSLIEEEDKLKWDWEAGRNWRRPVLPDRFQQTDRHPVACVSWNDAMAYIVWLNKESGEHYRLPTEAEWEYAARGGSTKARFWGDDPDRACRYANVADQTKDGTWSWGSPKHECKDGYFFASPVGSFRKNDYGLHDMLGNVWEWTCSEFDAGYGGKEEKCVGKKHAARPVLRGGSWVNVPERVRSA